MAESKASVKAQKPETPKTVTTTDETAATEAKKVESLDAVVSRTEKDAVDQLHRQKKVKILIPSGRGASERAPVMVAVNGREFLIVRDKEVSVPKAVVNVLNLAREKTPVTNVVNGQRTVAFEESQRIPYQILGYEE